MLALQVQFRSLTTLADGFLEKMEERPFVVMLEKARVPSEDVGPRVPGNFYKIEEESSNP
ncbi:MAG: hypothetical protein HY646_15650 [Acidobacteria bacterium]|nr:hypothetical protein [Acidobacteriota bacterium]